MKIDALDHPKTIDFAASLGVCMPQAIGHLELLWVFVGQKTPRGNIGRWSNAVIAHHAQWTGNPDDFVSALIAAGFVDEDEDHRLLIHDWEDHMPRWVKAKLSTQNEEVIRRDCITVCSNDDSQDDSADDSSDDSKDSSTDSVSEVKGSEVKGKEGKKARKRAPVSAKRAFFNFAQAHDALTEAEDYESVLKKKKAASTERAWKGRLKSIEEIAAKGQSVKAAIAKSADSGWTGIFEVKANGQSRPDSRKSASDRQWEAAQRQAAALD